MLLTVSRIQPLILGRCEPQVSLWHATLSVKTLLSSVLLSPLHQHVGLHAVLTFLGKVSMHNPYCGVGVVLYFASLLVTCTAVQPVLLVCFLQLSENASSLKPYLVRFQITHPSYSAAGLAPFWCWHRACVMLSQ